MRLPTHVDRPTLRLITVKRFVTGTASLLFAAGLAGYGVLRASAMAPTARLLCALGVVVFVVQGIWSLRDAVRGRRLLQRQP
jgi:uncharacterized membrane protein YqjE